MTEWWNFRFPMRGSCGNNLNFQLWVDLYGGVQTSQLCEEIYVGRVYSYLCQVKLGSVPNVVSPIKMKNGIPIMMPGD